MRPQRRQRPEQIGADHEHNVLAHALSELPRSSVGVIDQFQQRLPLHFLLPDLLAWIGEIEGEGTNVQLLNE